MTLFFCTLAFVCLYNGGAPQQHSVFAQSIPNVGDEAGTNNLTSINTTTTPPFSTYRDPIYGIKIEYPSNWNKTEGANFVEFSLPINTTITTATTPTNTTDLIALEIRVDVLPSDMISLEQYSRAKLISHRQIGEFDLIESNATTITPTEIPAFKVVYTNAFPKTGEVLKTMEIMAVKDSIGYDIRYFADPASDYSKYLSLVQKMINSFEFIGLTGS